MAAILKNRYDVVTLPPRKFDRPMQNDMPMTTRRSKSKSEVEFNMSDVCIQKPEVVIFQLSFKIVKGIFVDN